VPYSFQTSLKRYCRRNHENRFVDISGDDISPAVFDDQQFAGATLKPQLQKIMMFPPFPTMGMGFSIAGTWKMNLETPSREFIESKLNFAIKLMEKWFWPPS
jgi:hypothetical protein